MNKQHYLSPAKDAAKAAEAAVFASYREQVRAVDPDAVAADGTIIGRSAASGELEPNAARTTGYFGEPAPAVQGFVIPVPDDSELQLNDPAAAGVEETWHINPWPAPGPDGSMPPLPEWQEPQNAAEAYPAGAWVQHEGRAYCCITPGLTVAPAPQSTIWRVSPDPGPLPWVKPTDYSNAYTKDALVQHDGKFYRSTYAGNDQTPGSDPRYWVEVPAPTKAAADWVEPVPGDGSTLYEIEDEVMKDGTRWKSKAHLNAMEPGINEQWEEVAAP